MLSEAANDEKNLVHNESKIQWYSIIEQILFFSVLVFIILYA